MSKPKIFRVKTDEDVWKTFLQITNGLQPLNRQLTPKEVELVAYICSQDPNSDQLQGILLNKTLMRFPEKNKNLVAAEKARLKKKGWLEDVSGSTLISSHIRGTLQAFWKTKNKLPYTEIELTFKITNKTLEQELYG